MNLFPIFADQPVLVFGMPVSEELLIIVVVMGFVLITRTIKTMTAHQQRMAQILNPQNQTANPEIAALRQEVDILKATVNQQTLLIDSLSSQQRQLAESLKAPDSISQRLNAE